MSQAEAEAVITLLRALGCTAELVGGIPHVIYPPSLATQVERILASYSAPVVRVERVDPVAPVPIPIPIQYFNPPPLPPVAPRTANLTPRRTPPALIRGDLGGK